MTIIIHQVKHRNYFIQSSAKRVEFAKNVIFRKTELFGVGKKWLVFHENVCISVKVNTKLIPTFMFKDKHNKKRVNGKDKYAPACIWN